MTLGAAVAGGPAAGGGRPPGQRGVLATVLRRHRRCGRACPARGRGRRVRRRRGRRSRARARAGPRSRRSRGSTAGDVVFTTGSSHGLDILLADWRGPRTLACLPGEYGPNLNIMPATGSTSATLPGGRRRPARRRRGRAAAGLRSACPGPRDGAGQPSRHRATHHGNGGGVSRPRHPADRRCCAGVHARRLLAVRCDRHVFVVPQVGGGTAGSRRTGRARRRAESRDARPAGARGGERRCPRRFGADARRARRGGAAANQAAARRGRRADPYRAGRTRRAGESSSRSTSPAPSPR